MQDGFDTFLEMCERFIVGRKGGTSEKKNFFLHLISIWIGVLNYSKPKAVIVGSRPHRMFDLVLEIWVNIEYTFYHVRGKQHEIVCTEQI